MQQKNEPSYSGKALEISTIIFIICLTYAIIRYNIFREIDWSHLPLYINNKAISLAATVLLCLAYFSGFIARTFPARGAILIKLRSYLGLYGFGLASIHSLISTILLKDHTYYPFLFDHLGRYNLTGETMLLFGVISMFIFALVAVASIPGMQESLGMGQWLKIQSLGYWGLGVTFVHVLLIGYPNWVTIYDWPQRLPPITLLASLVIAITLLAKCISTFASRKIGK